MCSQLKYRLTCCLVGFASLLAPAGVRADDRYYMLIFAYQGVPAGPRTAHSFATFAHATQGKNGTHRLVDVKTISWMPATLNVRLIRGAPERGRNLSLKETLALANSMDANITLWGPYQIDKKLYDRAAKQVKRLDSGTVGYKALDGAVRPDGATNCFHAISDIDADQGLLNTGTAFGNDASAMVVRHLSRWIIGREKTHPWLIERLGLKNVEVEREID